MKLVNIILIILVVFFIILNLYHIFYVRKLALYNELNIENFTFADSYKDEEYSDGGSTFQICDVSNPACTTTYAELENNSHTFLTDYSNYHETYKLTNIEDSNHQFRKYNDIMTNKSLLAYRCLNKSPLKIKEYLDANSVTTLNNQNVFIPYLYKKLFLYDETSLYTYIANELSNIKYNLSSLRINMESNKGTDKILGPVYVCISQAPFIKYNGNMVKSRFDVTNNQRSYYFEEHAGGLRKYDLESGNGQDDKLSSLYTEILFILPMYNIVNTANGLTNISFSNDTNRMSRFLSLLETHFTHEKLCFLKCNKSPISCGCLNATEDDMKLDHTDTNIKPYVKDGIETRSIKQYNSVCYNHKDVVQDYSIMYFVNPYGNVNDQYILNTNR